MTVNNKHLLAGIKALCRGSGALHRADQASLTAAMKAAKLPPHIKTVTPGTPPTQGLSLSRTRRFPVSIVPLSKSPFCMYDFCFLFLFTSKFYNLFADLQFKIIYIYNIYNIYNIYKLIQMCRWRLVGRQPASQPAMASKILF